MELKEIVSLLFLYNVEVVECFFMISLSNSYISSASTLYRVYTKILPLGFKQS